MPAKLALPSLLAALAMACSDASISSIDRAPEVEILAPLDGASFIPGEPVELCAQVNDEDELEDLRIDVQSSVDGLIWTSGMTLDGCELGNVGLLLDLSDADHLLSISATDSLDQVTSAQVSIVASDNSAPWCEFVSPVAGDSIEIGQSFTVQALVGDAESVASELQVWIESDLEGSLYEEQPETSGEIVFDWQPAESGDHLLQLVVSDPRGLNDGCTASLYVDPCADQDEDGWTTCEGDCDDERDDIHPEAEEVADGDDNDCDGLADEGTNLYDDDEDGYSEADGDCDDGDPDTWPGADEDPYDGVDDACDGTVDEGGDSFDDDGDGWTEEAGDCDDDDVGAYPGADEDPANGVDDDCDGRVDEDDAGDLDGDGFTEDDGDCDDSSGWIHPEAYEFCDRLDNDCDGAIDEDCEEFDTGAGTEESDKNEECQGCRNATPLSSLAWALAGMLALLHRRRRA